jgi:hypothetical protein
MNAVIAGVAGAVLATLGTIGGVNAYQGDTDGVPASNLYTYADN